MELHPLQTARLRLEPLTMETARAILAGDLSGLAAARLAAADGWPHWVAAGTAARVNPRTAEADVT